MEWNFPGAPGGVEHIMQYSERELAKGAKDAMRMGPLRTGPPDWRQAGMAGATAFFSPWLGARMLNQVFGGFPGAGGGGGGGAGGGGLLSAMFGGESTGFAQWYLLIRAVTALTHAFNLMFDAIHKGSELYRQAAATATNVHTLSHAQAAMGGIGFSPGQVNAMIGQTQYGRGGQIRTAADVMVRARLGGAGMEDIQKIQNMNKELDYMFKVTAYGSEVAANAAASMNRLNMAMSALKTDWNSLWMDLAKTFELPLRILIKLGDMVIQGFNRMLEAIQAGWGAVLKGFANMLGPYLGPKFLKSVGNLVFPFTAPGDTRIGGQMTARPEGAWERMGLIINGGIMGRDYARQTAENTKKIADHVAKIFPVADPTWGANQQQPNFNWP
jgi:hypothetical protein